MFLAFKELRFYKLRYSLIGLIMILITWLVFLISGLANGLASDNAAALQNMPAHLYVLQSGSEKTLSRSQVNDSTWQQIKKETGNDPSISPMGRQRLSITKKQAKHKMDVMVLATDATSPFTPSVQSGNPLQPNETKQVLVDQSLQQEGIHIGDWIQDPSSDLQWKVVGFTKEQRLSHSPVVFMNLKDWKMLQQTYSPSKKVVYNAVATQMNTHQANDLKKQVKDIEIITKDDMLSHIPGFKEEQGSLNMMIAFLLVISSFVQAVFFYVMTLQKTSQFGVLKAIGAQTSQLTRSLVSQVFVLSVFAIVIGFGFTYVTKLLLPASLPFQLNLNACALFAILFLVVAMIGSLLSLYRVIKIDAMDAIGRVA